MHPHATDLTNTKNKNERKCVKLRFLKKTLIFTLLLATLRTVPANSLPPEIPWGGTQDHKYSRRLPDSVVPTARIEYQYWDKSQWQPGRVTMPGKGCRTTAILQCG
jgi:hypothetical protein